MDPGYAMFLIVPLNERKGIDWVCVERVSFAIYNSVALFVLKPELEL